MDAKGVLLTIFKVLMTLVMLVCLAIFAVSIYFYVGYDNAKNISDFKLANAKKYTFVTGEVDTLVGVTTNGAFEGKSKDTATVFGSDYYVYTVAIGVKEDEGDPDKYMLYDTPAPDPEEEAKKAAENPQEYISVLVKKSESSRFEQLSDVANEDKSASFTGMIIKNPVKLDKTFLMQALGFEFEYQVDECMDEEYAVLALSKDMMTNFMLVCGLLFIVSLVIVVTLRFFHATKY